MSYLQRVAGPPRTVSLTPLVQTLVVELMTNPVMAAQSVSTVW